MGLKACHPVADQATCVPNKLFNEIIISRILLLYSLLILATGIIIESPSGFLYGMRRIIYSSSALTTDYMELASPGTAMINAGIMTLFYYLILKLSQVRLSGATLAAFFMLSGFSLFGKNLFSAVPISAGVFLYSVITKKRFKDYALLALFGTCLGPLISTVAFHIGLPLGQGILYAYLLGLLSGFLLPPLSNLVAGLHQGHTLYNLGFAAGLYSVFVVIIMRLIGYSFLRQDITYVMDSIFLLIWLLILLILLFLAGIILDNFRLIVVDDKYKLQRFKPKYNLLTRYKHLLSRSGRLVMDFPDDYGISLTLINMGLTGLIAVTYALIVGGNLNGPIIGAILSVVGFAAYGKHPLNIMPILLGVLLLNLLSGNNYASTFAVISGLLGTNLAPMAGRFGILPGLLTGMVHMIVVPYVGILHAGVNLYNNGLSGGLVATVLVPIFSYLERHKFLPRHFLSRIFSLLRKSIFPD